MVQFFGKKCFAATSAALLAVAAAVLFLNACNREPVPEPATPELTVNVESLSFAGHGGPKNFTVKSSGSWTATASENWLTLTPAAGESGKTVTAVAKANTATTQRTATVEVALKDHPDVKVQIAVTQAEAGGADPGPGPGPGPDDDGPDTSTLVIPKSDFTEPSVWSVTGSIMDLGWTKDLEMLEETSHGWIAAFDVVVNEGGEFKFRKDADWASNLGAGKGQPELDKRYKLADDGGNFKLPAGTYDLYIQPTFMLLYVLEAGATFTHGDAVAEAETGENLRIFLLNNSKWTKPYMYAYVGTGELQPYGNWPGTYASGTKVYGDYTWTYWEASGFNGVGNVNLILNNNGEDQHPADGEKEPLWSGLTILNNLYFVWDGKKVTQVDDPSNPGVTGKGIVPDEMKFGSSSWTLIGTLGGTNWDYDFPMDTEGFWEVAREISIAGGEVFKFRQGRNWNGANYGYGEYLETGSRTVKAGEKLELQSGGANMSIAAGTYDVYLSVENKLCYILTAGSEWTHEKEGKPDYMVSGDYDDKLNPAKKASGLTYQINVFSFKDSDGDGYGDLNGITQNLDYFDKLGVTALWLSPLQPAQSYHGYDVTDYEAVNKRYGTEEDFQTLITEAHKHNIRIYMDYVINHSGDMNKWFMDIKEKGPKSEYWDYYSLSKNPEADIKAGKIAQVDPGAGFDKYKWYPVTVGGKGEKRYKIDLDWTSASAPKMTVTETTAEPTDPKTASYNNEERYLYWGSGTYTRFADNGAGKYTVTLDYKSDWGCLVRTTKEDVWTGKTKWGFNKTGDQMKLGEAHTLYSDDNPDNVQSIIMPGGEVYYYYTEFGTGMFVDFNYGKADQCASSAAFKAIMHGVEKWLKMGVDGFRLDAVKHIYHNETGPENKLFWKAFYDASNVIYKANKAARSGLSGIVDENIFMVGEVLSGDGDCTPFYQGLPALFEFQFWWDLRECLNNETIHRAGYGQNFPGSLLYRWDGHRQVRPDAISTPKLANHDEDRTASSLGNYKPKIRLAAAVLLTSPGRPYIYQGEELGYWGTKSGGDEYVRTPILWTTSQSSAASKGVSNKVDWGMLQPSISVESQSADETSLLYLYRHFGYARSTHPALSNGYPEPDNITVSGLDGKVAGWYLHALDGTENVLVLHNFSGGAVSVDRSSHGDDLSKLIVSNGRVTVSGSQVNLPAYSSAVFQVE